MRRKCIFILVLLTLLGLSSLLQADQYKAQEYHVKAIFLLNFAHFVSWPEEAFDSETDSLVIGILGESPFGDVLGTIIKDEKIDKRGLSVRYFEKVSEIDCHILFTLESNVGKLRELFKMTSAEHTLTVGESSSFIAEGGMVEFVRVKNNVKFNINTTRTSEAGLQTSSKLLKVAENIIK